jgi:hypothetical protein
VSRSQCELARRVLRSQCGFLGGDRRQRDLFPWFHQSMNMKASSGTGVCWNAVGVPRQWTRPEARCHRRPSSRARSKSTNLSLMTSSVFVGCSIGKHEARHHILDSSRSRNSDPKAKVISIAFATSQVRSAEQAMVRVGNKLHAFAGRHATLSCSSCPACAFG